MSRACSVEGCANDARSGTAQHCEAHYYRLRRTGNLGEQPIAKKRHGDRECAADGCPTVIRKGTYCAMHRARAYRHGDPTIFVPYDQRDWGSGPAHHSWKGDAVTYAAAHNRVRRLQGPASLHLCPCGKPAQHWAYLHGSEKEVIDRDGFPFSPDPADYRALCVSCHKRFDLARKAKTAADRKDGP